MCFYELISAVLTAQNMALIDLSKTTLSNVLFLLNTSRQNVLASSG
jgi:hypothetical protein